jgi:hypothetical protein
VIFGAGGRGFNPFKHPERLSGGSCRGITLAIPYKIPYAIWTVPPIPVPAHGALLGCRVSPAFVKFGLYRETRTNLQELSDGPACE